MNVTERDLIKMDPPKESESIVNDWPIEFTKISFNVTSKYHALIDNLALLEMTETSFSSS